MPVGLFCFELLYADGQDLTESPYLDRRARLAEAVTLSDRLRLTTALVVATAPALDARFEQAVADGSEGLVCKSTAPEAVYQAGARGWLWIKLKRDYRTELADKRYRAYRESLPEPIPPKRKHRRPEVRAIPVDPADDPRPHEALRDGA